MVVRLEGGMRDGEREKRRGEPGRGCRFWLRVISSFGGRDAQAVAASLHPALRKAAPPAAKPARCWESPVRDATGAAPAPAICPDAAVLQCEILGRRSRTLDFSKIGARSAEPSRDGRALERRDAVMLSRGGIQR